MSQEELPQDKGLAPVQLEEANGLWPVDWRYSDSWSF